MTPADAPRLAGLVEARKARDLARLDALLAEDRAPRRRDRRPLGTAAARPRHRHRAAAAAAGAAPGLGRPAHPRRPAPARAELAPAIARRPRRGGAEPRQAPRPGKPRRARRPHAPPASPRPHRARGPGPRSPRTTDPPASAKVQPRSRRSAMPSSSVDQRSPGRTGCASVSVPVVTISPACSGAFPGNRAISSTRNRSASIGPPSTWLACPSATTSPSRAQRHRELRERRRPPRPVVPDRVPRPDHQRPVQPEGRRRLRPAELPAGIDRLHDLEAVRHPVDAPDQLRRRHPRLRRPTQVQHDLRLDPRLRQLRQLEAARQVRRDRAPWCRT